MVCGFSKHGGSQFSSVQSLSRVRLLRPHESQHARPPCPSPTPGVHSNSCPSSQRCHPAISSSVIPFSSCPQSLPASESFLVLLEEGVCYDQCVLLAKLYEPLPCFILYSKAKFACHSRCLLTFLLSHSGTL